MYHDRRTEQVCKFRDFKCLKEKFGDDTGLYSEVIHLIKWATL